MRSFDLCGDKSLFFTIFFFFQAEDGIRDKLVTGVQTCALPICLFDATMIVMGGIIGSGIFMNPSVVALQVHTPFLILGAWAIGGLFALAAAFIRSEERRVGKECSLRWWADDYEIEK